jgi:hypothetical protein
MKHRLKDLDEAQRENARPRWCARCGYYTVQIPMRKHWWCLRGRHVVKEASNER